MEAILANSTGRTAIGVARRAEARLTRTANIQICRIVGEVSSDAVGTSGNERVARRLPWLAVLAFVEEVGIASLAAGTSEANAGA